MLKWLRNLLSSDVQQPAVVPAIEAAKPLAEVATIPERDAFEGWYNGIEGPDLKFELDAEIDYVDGNGHSTSRRVTIHRFAPDYAVNGAADFMLLGRCHLRNANRSFLGSRINRFVCLETGEVAQDVKAFLLDLYANSSAGRTEALLERLADELSVLVYIARADQRLSAKEKLYLIDYLRQAEPTLELDRSTIDSAVAIAPSRTKVTQTIKMLRQTGRAEALLPFVQGLRGARSKPDAFTEAAVAQVVNELTKGSRGQSASGHV